MDGILVIDKPKGPTSFDVIRKVRKLAKTKKVGHAGTLDPLASGLLIVCLGRYTKLIPLLMDGSKVYETVVTLGITTTTDDAEGEIIKQTNVSCSLEQIKDALGEFRGPIKQRPPIHSAIKIDGQKAYTLARNNKAVTLAEREVEIFTLSLNNWSPPDLTLTIHCSKGTYIRSIARDLGEKLSVGGYAKEIRRLQSGGFNVKDALSFHDLSDEMIERNLITDCGRFLGIETIQISEEDKAHATCGRKLSSHINFNSDMALATYNNMPIAILAKESNTILLKRVI